MIAGAMPKWRQYFYRFAAGLMCVCFAALGFITRFLFTAGTHADNARTTVSLIFVALATLAIAGQFWYQRRLVCEFDFDGSTLRFRTLGIRQTHVRPLADVAHVKDWRG